MRRRNRCYSALDRVEFSDLFCQGRQIGGAAQLVAALFIRSRRREENEKEERLVGAEE